MDTTTASRNRKLPLATPTDLGAEASRDIAAALTALLADVFTLYVKTKNFRISVTITRCWTSRAPRSLP